MAGELPAALRKALLGSAFEDTRPQPFARFLGAQVYQGPQPSAFFFINFNGIFFTLAVKTNPQNGTRFLIPNRFSPHPAVSLRKSPRHPHGGNALPAAVPAPQHGWLLGTPLHQSLKLEVICANEASRGWSWRTQTRRYTRGYRVRVPARHPATGAAGRGRSLARSALCAGTREPRALAPPVRRRRGKKKNKTNHHQTPPQKKPNYLRYDSSDYEGELVSLHLSQDKKKKKNHVCWSFIFIYG